MKTVLPLISFLFVALFSASCVTTNTAGPVTRGAVKTAPTGNPGAIPDATPVSPLSERIVSNSGSRGLFGGTQRTTLIQQTGVPIVAGYETTVPTIRSRRGYPVIVHPGGYVQDGPYLHPTRGYHPGTPGTVRRTTNSGYSGGIGVQPRTGFSFGTFR